MPDEGILIIPKDDTWLGSLAAIAGLSPAAVIIATLSLPGSGPSLVPSPKPSCPLLVSDSSSSSSGQTSPDSDSSTLGLTFSPSSSTEFQREAITGENKRVTFVTL